GGFDLPPPPYFGGYGGNAINVSVRFVAQRGFVGVPFSASKPSRCGIVLNDIVIPINHPNGAIGPYLGADRCGPFVIAGGEIRGVMRREVRAMGFEKEQAEQVACGFCHELPPVPILLREFARRVDGAARPRSVAPEG